MPKFEVFLRLLFASHLVSIASAAFTRPVVDLGYAKYQGIQDAVTGTSIFLGIRYAAAPREHLRWRAPQEPETSHEIIDASSLGPQCYQGGVGNSAMNPYGHLFHPHLFHPQLLVREKIVETKSNMSEDCLILNIYAPKASQTKKLPVLVWIHGGGYAFGHAPNSGKDLIAESNGQVVVVMIQYRLGLFGFLPGSQVKHDGVLNAGLLDQQFALKWVQKHISRFGGDPKQVTIWGQSAGGGSVLQHIIANNGETKPALFKRAITNSAFLPYQYKYNDVIPEALFNQTVHEVGCGQHEDKMSCLRKTNINVLEKANMGISREGYMGLFQYVPVVDGTFIQQSPVAALTKRRINGEAYLGVTNTNEGDKFVNPRRKLDSLEHYLRNAIPSMNDTEDMRRVASTYSKISGVEGIHSQAATLIGELIFKCPTYYLLDAYGIRGHKAEFAIPSAFHSADLPYYFISSHRSYNNPTFVAAFSQSFMNMAIFGNVNRKFTFLNTTPFWSGWTFLHTEMLFNVTENSHPDIRSKHTDIGLINRCELWRSLAPKTGQ